MDFQKWRFIETEPLDAYTNMAVDHAILESVAKGESLPTIRFYRWHPPGVTIGYFQKINKEIDTDACEKSGVDVVRRLTGGRAVLHQHELTYSLIAPEDHPKVSGTILESYLAISKGLLLGLKNLGIKGQLVDGAETKRKGTAACFDAPSWYELVVDNKKIIGSAQTRKQGALLQHGSVLIKLDNNLLFNILNFSSDKVRQAAKEKFAGKAISLTEALGFVPDYSQVVKAFKDGLTKGLEIDLSDGSLSDSEKQRTEELETGKYRTNEWNYKR